MNTRLPISTLTPTASEAQRRPADFLQPLARRVDQRPMTNQPQVQDPRKLTVSRGITLTGELKGCAKLIIEGRVEAALHDCVTLEIAEHGHFDGKAEVETCEVKGTVAGDLTVRGRLVIRATGKVLGKVRYLDLHIEPGGKLAGQIEALEAPAETGRAPEVAAAAAAVPPRFTLAQAEPARPTMIQPTMIQPTMVPPVLHPPVLHPPVLHPPVLQPLELTEIAEEPARGFTAERG